MRIYNGDGWSANETVPRRIMRRSRSGLWRRTGTETMGKYYLSRMYCSVACSVALGGRVLGSDVCTSTCKKIRYTIIREFTDDPDDTTHPITYGAGRNVQVTLWQAG